MNQRQEAFLDQLKAYRGYILKLARETSEDEAEITPNGFNNNIRWNLGHVYTEQYMWLKTLTNEEVPVPEAFDHWFGFGSSPANFTAETPSLEELKTLLKEQLPEIKDTFGDRLEEEFEPTENWGLRTIEQVLMYTLFHEGMHIQTILDIKKCMKAE